MGCFSQIIDLWPDLGEFAREVGVRRTVAYHWRERDSIPAEWFCAVVRAAADRGIEGVTAERLADLAEARRLSKAAQPADAGASA